MAYSIKLTLLDGSTYSLSDLFEGTTPRPKELIEVNVDGQTVRAIVEMVVVVERLPGETAMSSLPSTVYVQELR